MKNGLPRKAMMVLHDLTDIRKAEEERRVLEVKLQNVRKLESLGTLAGGVAHDLNNILSGIVGYPDLLLHTLAADSPLRNPLMAIRKSGEKAAEIVQDLLTLSRKGVAVKKIVNLNPIVQDFLSSPEYRSRVTGRSDIRLQLQLPNSVLNIMGHEVTLSKVLMNLVVNAIEAMPAGGLVTVATRNRYLDRPHTGFEVIPEGEYVILEVSDRGISISMSDLEKIFEPFYTKKVMGRSGTGLGMSVVWGALKDHGGFIDIISEEGSGTAFHLYFPASRLEPQASSVVYIDDYLGKGESLLIVDDAPEQRDLLRGMMQRLGYQVDTAASGEDAVALLKEKSFDLMILDMIMPPGMDGLDTYRQVIDIVPAQRAVIASGFAETERVHEAQQRGAGPYIKKPFTLEKIGLAVRKELDRKRGEAATR